MSGGGSDEVRGIGGGGRRTEAQAPAVGLTAAVGPHCRRLDGGTHCGLVLHVPRVAWSVCLSVCLFVLYTETQAPAVGLSTAVGPHCRRLDGGTHCGLVLHVPRVAWSLCLSVCLSCTLILKHLLWDSLQQWDLIVVDWMEVRTAA